MIIYDFNISELYYFYCTIVFFGSIKRREKLKLNEFSFSSINIVMSHLSRISLFCCKLNEAAGPETLYERSPGASCVPENPENRTVGDFAAFIRGKRARGFTTCRWVGCSIDPDSPMHSKWKGPLSAHLGQSRLRLLAVHPGVAIPASAG